VAPSCLVAYCTLVTEASPYLAARTRMEHTFFVTDVDDSANRSAIAKPLVEYNTRRAGPSGFRHLAVLLKDGSGTVVGGLWGNTAYDWLTIYLLAVPTELRGRGIGAELMRLAEHEAEARGCYGAWLDTLEFQAKGFYERVGYGCFGELPEYPNGFRKFFMKKEFRHAKEREL
jgi:GNAT superfamily N-acetyltransferase